MQEKSTGKNRIEIYSFSFFTSKSNAGDSGTAAFEFVFETEDTINLNWKS